jgi:hypothetical protein
VNVEALSCAFLFLSDGRLFVRRSTGEIREADASERRYAVHLLALEEESARVDPMRGLEVMPPAPS